MKKIGFIGIYDKIDMLLNVAKILTVMEDKVLIIDTTTNQKARYIVPSIEQKDSYITTFEDIDIAIGFNNIEEIVKYNGISIEANYDIVLVNVDDEKQIKEFNIDNSDINFFVTSFDLYSLKRGLEILDELEQNIKLTKIYYSKDILKEDEEYFNYISEKYKNIEWDDNKVYFPLENGDLSVIYENQRVQKIKLKKLSVQYKEALGMIINQILGENDDSYVRRVIKKIEKGV